MSDRSRFIRCLQSHLTSMGLCSTTAEANAIAEELTDQDIPFEESAVYLQTVTDSFGDYFSDDSDIIRSVIRSAAMECWGSNSPAVVVQTGSNESEENSNVHSQDEEESDIDDNEWLGEGECELCERTIKLTRHHLTPKSTWPRIKKKLWHAASEIEMFHSETNLEKRDMLQEKLQKTVGIRNIQDLPPTLSHTSIRNYLSRVCTICRPCHSAVHRIHGEWELATEYNTVDQLLECQDVRKFAKWASKQRLGKYAVS